MIVAWIWFLACLPNVLGFVPTTPLQQQQQRVGSNSFVPVVSFQDAAHISSPLTSKQDWRAPTLSHGRRSLRRLEALPNDCFDLPGSLLTAFDTFDGSSIVDPVVVSNAFWATLGTKIASLLLGQLISTIVFSVVIAIAASQLSGIVDRVTKGIVDRLLGPPPPTLRMPPDNDGKAQQTNIDLQKLLVCVAIDIVGTSSELVPIVGEFTDVIYAPIAATLLRNLYGSNVVFLLEFAEEILPFTDIIPLATICWFVDTLAPASGLARLLRLGDYRQGAHEEGGVQGSSTSVIDTTLESEKKGEDRSPR